MPSRKRNKGKARKAKHNNKGTNANSVDELQQQLRNNLSLASNNNEAPPGALCYICFDDAQLYQGSSQLEDSRHTTRHQVCF